MEVIFARTERILEASRTVGHSVRKVGGGR